MIKAILILAELILLWVFIFPITLKILNIGNAIGIAFCVACLIVTAFSEKAGCIVQKLWNAKAGKIVCIAFIIVVILCIVYAVMLSALMAKASNNPPKEPDILIVLGCKVNGSTPSQMLRRRLDATYEYMLDNEDVKCIVSGGKGANEDISEAQAMYNYLTAKGISADRIIIEDKSTSTKENLEFSKAILDELNLPYNITIVSDSYHQFRAKLIAQELGYENIHSVSGYTRTALIPTYWIREWLGITAQLVF